MRDDITGKTFFRLTAVSLTGRNARGQAIWKFRCSCGGERITLSSSVKQGFTKSCGCLNMEVAARRGEMNATHGYHASPTYTSYHSMLQRCLNPKNASFKTYGALGVSVCDRWLGSFENFLADMGERPPNTTLDRRDGTRGYEPENCRWATRREQNNNLRSNRRIAFDGKEMTLSEWARAAGIPGNTLRKRLEYMTIADALTKPHVIRRRH